MVDLARKMLFYDKLRFAITVAGVAFAVTLVVVQVGLFSGMLTNASVTIDRANADLWITSRNTPNVDFGHAFPEENLQRVRGVPGVARADNLIVFYAPMALPSGAEETVVIYGMEDLKKWGLPWHILEGDISDLRRGSFMFFDESSKRRLGPFQTGDYRELAGRRLQIVGRTSGAKSFTTMPIAFVDYQMAQKLTALDGRTMYVLVKLADGVAPGPVIAELKKRLPYNDVYTAKQWSERSKEYWIVNTGLGMSMFLTVFLGCLVGIVIVAQTLYASTMEHIKEYATLKAIGGTNGDIYAILLRQATLSAVVGFLVGLLPSFGFRALAGYADFDITITPFLLVTVGGASVVLCALSAMVSFGKIANIDPALVLRG